MSEGLPRWTRTPRVTRRQHHDDTGHAALESDLQWCIEAGMALGYHGRQPQDDDPCVAVYRCQICGAWLIETPLEDTP
jgi:hypothetical protein